ncbi:hypothetical protein MLD38_011506 [Melastoma candidum]|uniref:Uncharacterized protein n=1 Tax=Melastoma candidum TaxID=119954 RepID=A0ACB9R3A8_9MYRT|nr:hypothetical protein MLD38_011506 [Melastoma candidum]
MARPEPAVSVSGSRRHGFIVPSMFLSLILFLSSTSISTVYGNNTDSKVGMAIYYETLCPYSSDFIVNGLNPQLFTNGLISIVNLKLLPYGNAHVGPNATITCQHGPSECLLNAVEACAIDIWPDLRDHFPLIYCIEELVQERNYTQWKSCFNQLGLDATAISECYTNGRGKKLELGYAAETNALQPPHQYVPWVVVNGEPLYDDYEDFVSYVCKAYSGTSLPEACSNTTVNPASLMMSMKKASRVCRRTATAAT